MATFGRLLGFLRPYRWGLIWSGLLAVVALTMTAAIPWLTGRAIDQMRAGDQSGLNALAFAVLGAGVLRMALTVARRLIAGRVSLGVELDLRTRMYAHLQSLELAFFDRQQTGQLMSRATVDLQSVRFFLGYGLIFMLQSGLTIVLAAVAMFLTEPGLAAISLAPVPVVVFVAARYGRDRAPRAAGGPAADRRADRRRRGERQRRARGEGVRARGAPARALPRAGRARVRPVDGHDADAGVLQPVHRLRPADRARRDPVLRRPPGDQRDAHDRPVQRVLRLPADAAVAHADARHLARPRPARDGRRRAALPDPRPPAADRRAARTRRGCRPATAASSCAT